MSNNDNLIDDSKKYLSQSKFELGIIEGEKQAIQDTLLNSVDQAVESMLQEPLNIKDTYSVGYALGYFRKLNT